MSSFPHGHRRRAALSLPCLALLAGFASPGIAHAAPKPEKLKPVGSSTVSTADERCTAKPKTLAVGGSCKWQTTLRFRVGGDDVERATLRMRLKASTSGTIRVKDGAGVLATSRARKGTRSFDVLDALPGEEGVVTLIVESSSSSTGRFSSALLELRAGTPDADTDEPDTIAKPGPSLTPPAPAPAPAVPAPAVPAPGVGAPTSPTNSSAVWLERAQIQALRTDGQGWTRVKAAADAGLGTPDISNQDSNHDVNTLATALVYVRTGNETYRAKAATAISGAIGTEDGGRTLALGRNLVSYVIAADLIGLASYDGALDGHFRTWLTGVRTETLDGKTLVSTHEERPNNWGTMAGASRIAADLYLGDGTDLARAATVLRGYLGDRGAYAGFSYGDLSYQADPNAPVGINPVGATKSGVDIDGAIPDDMRRGCSFQIIPCHTNYAWEAMQGVVVQAELLAKHGHDAFGWSDRAVLRAAQYLHRLDQQYGDWWAASDDQWQPWLINAAYGTSLPAGHGGPGKLFGWTDWVYGA